MKPLYHQGFRKNRLRLCKQWLNVRPSFIYHQLMTQKLYLIDGSGFIFRAYHALPPLTSPDGTPVGAVVGFMNMLIKLRREHEGDYMAVIFDAARKTFRNRIYEEYKANRPPPPDDLIPQFAIVREATKALGLPALDTPDFEADDIIATYARVAQKENMEVVVVSSDKDLMQLVGNGITMFDAMKQRTIGEEQVQEKFAVAPDKVRHVLALMGDSSDNVPGVPGIGPKTAAELINTYGDVETLLSRADEIKQNKRRETIKENAEMARISYELIGLKEDVPLPAPMDDLLTTPLPLEDALAFCEKYGLKATMARLQANSQEVKTTAKTTTTGTTEETKATIPTSPVLSLGKGEHTALTNEKELSDWVARAKQKGVVAFDTETTSLDAHTAELVGFSLCVEAGKACYVPLAHLTEGEEKQGAGQSDMFADAPKAKTLAPNQIPMEKALALIKPLLEDPSVLKIGHNMKYDLLVMQNHGANITPIDDTMLLSYCLHAGEHGQSMDELADRYLAYKTIGYDEVTGKGKNRKRFDEVEIDAATPYAAEDADITMRLWEVFKPQVIAEKMTSLYETIERPLVGVLSSMETCGIKLDMPKLAELSKDFEGRMHELERDIHKLAGVEFNVGSPKQLGEVLFENLGLEGGKKSSKTGAYSTDSDTLETLAAQGHEIAEKAISWRQLSKLKSTYTDALANCVNEKTRRVHTSFAQAITSTGRLSSSDPNLQNIPIRTEEGRKIREAFIAEEGHILLAADYSQIELRLLADMANIDVLKEAFKNGDDIHAITASQMFDVSLSEVSSEQRRNAKMINFGIIYGISAHGLATRLSIERSEAANYIEQYFTQYPGIRTYMETQKDFARKHGYVETLFGRRCHVPSINDKNGNRRQFGERAAINAPLQGTAADIIKKAMINVQNALPNSARMLLQVHDELVFEVQESAANDVIPMIKQAMENAASLSVPLTVEVGSGKHWGEAH